MRYRAAPARHRLPLDDHQEAGTRALPQPDGARALREAPRPDRQQDLLYRRRAGSGIRFVDPARAAPQSGSDERRLALEYVVVKHRRSHPGAARGRPPRRARARSCSVLRDRSVEGRLVDRHVRGAGRAHRIPGEERRRARRSSHHRRAPARHTAVAGPCSPRSRWLWRGLQADVEAAWTRPRVPTLALPRADRVRLVGRARSELRLRAARGRCVSRRHARALARG